MTTPNTSRAQFPLDDLTQYLSPEWLETSLPERGADCPLALDLMMAVLNRAWESDPKLKQHVDSCLRCASRLQSLELAVNAPRPVLSPSIRDQYHDAPAVRTRRTAWTGRVPTMALAAEGNQDVIAIDGFDLVLPSEQHGSLAFHVRLRFGAKITPVAVGGPPAPQSWYFSIHLDPYDAQEKDRPVPPEKLNRLNHVAVRITLKTREPVDFHCAQTRLDLDVSRNILDSQPVLLNIENPNLVESLELIEVNPLRGYDVP